MCGLSALGPLMVIFAPFILVDAIVDEVQSVSNNTKHACASRTQRLISRLGGEQLGSVSATWVRDNWCSNPLSSTLWRKNKQTLTQAKRNIESNFKADVRMVRIQAQLLTLPQADKAQRAQLMLKKAHLLMDKQMFDGARDVLGKLELVQIALEEKWHYYYVLGLCMLYTNQVGASDQVCMEHAVDTMSVLDRALFFAQTSADASYARHACGLALARGVVFLRNNRHAEAAMELTRALNVAPQLADKQHHQLLGSIHYHRALAFIEGTLCDSGDTQVESHVEQWARQHIRKCLMDASASLYADVTNIVVRLIGQKNHLALTLALNDVEAALTHKFVVQIAGSDRASNDILLVLQDVVQNLIIQTSSIVKFDQLRWSYDKCIIPGVSNMMMHHPEVKQLVSYKRFIFELQQFTILA